MRFLLDMGIASSIVHSLRALGHDARHLRDEDLHRLSDLEILNKARREDRVVLTHDVDFTHLLVLGEETKPSVVTFRLSDMRANNVYVHLLAALGQFSGDLESGAVVSIGDRAARCRRLPIRSGG